MSFEDKIIKMSDSLMTKLGLVRKSEYDTKVRVLDMALATQVSSDKLIYDMSAELHNLKETKKLADQVITDFYHSEKEQKEEINKLKYKLELMENYNTDLLELAYKVDDALTEFKKKSTLKKEG